MVWFSGTANVTASFKFSPGWPVAIATKFETKSAAGRPYKRYRNPKYRCHETPHRARRVHRAQRAASRRAWRVTGRFAPSSVLRSLIQHFLLIFLLIQLKSKQHRLDVLTIFQRDARGAVFRDTLSRSRVTCFRPTWL